MLVYWTERQSRGAGSSPPKLYHLFLLSYSYDRKINRALHNEATIKLFFFIRVCVCVSVLTFSLLPSLSLFFFCNGMCFMGGDAEIDADRGSVWSGRSFLV